MCSDHRHLTAYQIGCEVGQYVVLVLRPAILDRHILALDVAGFANALLEWGQIPCTISKRRATEESDHRCRSLLCPRRNRPRCRRAAQSQDELATFHRADPKPEDHAEYSRSRPCIAAKAVRSCPLCAIKRHMRCSKFALYSITSSASASSLSGTSSPSAFAVLRLSTNSNFVARMTGSSPGFSPLRIRPA
jgi:hypothetical protein